MFHHQQQATTITATPIIGEQQEFSTVINKNNKTMMMEDTTEKTACCSESDDDESERGGDMMEEIMVTKILPMMMTKDANASTTITMTAALTCLFLFMGTTYLTNFVVGVMIVLSYSSLSRDKLMDFYNQINHHHHAIISLFLFVGTTLLTNFVVGVMVALSYSYLSYDALVDFYKELTDNTTSLTTEEEEEEETTTTPSSSSDNSVLANLWIGLYRSVPVIYFPGTTTLDVSFTIFSALALYGVRLTLKMIMMSPQLVGWQQQPEQPDVEASSQTTAWELEQFLGYSVAAIHSMSLVPGAVVALQSLPNWTLTAPLHILHQDQQDLIQALLQFCTGYMVYDALTADFDPLFLGHHLISIVYLTQCRVLQAGHTSALLCMVLGEITNPFQNGYLALGHVVTNGCCNGPTWLVAARTVLQTIWAYSFFVARAIILPFGLLPFVTYGFFFVGESSTRKNIHLGNRILWAFLIWSIALGSYGHLLQCWELMTTGEGN